MDNINIKIYDLEKLEKTGILPIIDMVRSGNDGILSIKRHDKIRMEMGTGLIDADKKEIYTGDIAVIHLENESGSIEKRLGIMAFEGGTFKFNLKGDYSPGIVRNAPLVIGSRNTNPRLLEQFEKGEMLI